MSNFQNALADYQGRASSLAQQSLQELDEVKSSKAALLQGDASTLTGKTGTIFTDKIKEEGQKLQSELGLDLSVGGLAPTVLKVGSYLAKARASQLNSKWKDVNSERFNEKENAPKEPEEPEPEPETEEPPLSTNANEMELQEPEPAFDPKLFDVPKPEVEAPEPEISETSFMDKDPTEDEIGNAPEEDLSGITQEGGEIAEELAPEITQSISTLSSIGDGLLSAIPVVGGIASLAGAITGGIGLAETIKESNENPYASIQGKLNAYQQKIGGLENQVSADQFESKLGAGMPRFGSLSVPQVDTAQMSNVALHS